MERWTPTRGPGSFNDRSHSLTVEDPRRESVSDSSVTYCWVRGSRTHLRGTTLTTTEGTSQFEVNENLEKSPSRRTPLSSILWDLWEEGLGEEVRLPNRDRVGDGSGPHSPFSHVQQSTRVSGVSTPTTTLRRRGRRYQEAPGPVRETHSRTRVRTAQRGRVFTCNGCRLVRDDLLDDCAVK